MVCIPSMQVGKPDKVVVGYLDGRRPKGFVFDFPPPLEQFRLFPEENSPQDLGTDVKLESLKAIFFVKDVTGNPEHDSNTFKRVPRGQSLEVTFQDGEKIAGTTETYSHNDVGFFLSPADPDSNNVRSFVVNKNVRKVKLFM